MVTQLPLPFVALPCLHKHRFASMAYVPAGVVCSDCGELLSQYIPQPPAVLGYVSADWAWRHRDGKQWISSVDQDKQ